MTDRRTSSCTLCMLLPLLLGLVGLAIAITTLNQMTKNSKAEYIQNDLSLKSNQLLKEHQIGNTIVNLQGRDATLTGKVTSQQRSDEIEQLLSAMPGIRSVDNQLTIAKVEPIATESNTVVASNSEPEETKQTEKIKKEVVEELLQTIDLSGITFLFDSNEITPKGRLILSDVVSILKKHPEFNVVIEGHTDNAGDDALNLHLSQQRAQSVLAYLNNNGIQAGRLTAKGFGESSPIASNDSVEGRAQNRRIEFVVSRIQ